MSFVRIKTTNNCFNIITVESKNVFAPELIDDFHGLGKKNDQVIVKFTRRKDCKQVLQVKKGLKDLTADGLDLPWVTKICVNQSLCPYYRIL